MDPRTGEILALANWPRVDANNVDGAPEYARRNRAIQANYEPGSTFKAFTVSGAIEEGLVTPDTQLSVPPFIQVADRTVGEAHDGGGGTLQRRRHPGPLLERRVGDDRPEARRRALRPLGAAVRLRRADRGRPARRGGRHRPAPGELLGLVDGEHADRPGHRGDADADGRRVHGDREPRDHAAPVRRSRATGRGRGACLSKRTAARRLEDARGRPGRRRHRRGGLGRRLHAGRQDRYSGEGRSRAATRRRTSSPPSSATRRPRTRACWWR